jgi:GNAT superfamily N-acetyltransferase
MIHDESGLLLVMPVSEPWQVEVMRQIYNSCLDGYTKRLTPRNEKDQQDWWRTQGPETIWAYLYLPVEEPWKFIGFSCIRKHGDGAMSPIMGVKPGERGHGYGKAIVRHYISTVDGPLVGEALAGNDAINTINEELGWKVVGEVDGVLKLFHPRHTPKDRQDEIYREIVEYHSR